MRHSTKQLAIPAAGQCIYCAQGDTWLQGNQDREQDCPALRTGESTSGRIEFVGGEPPFVRSMWGHDGAVRTCPQLVDLQ
eukprot:1155204-Pelagomonas_calceolata.AAC.2